MSRAARGASVLGLVSVLAVVASLLSIAIPELARWRFARSKAGRDAVLGQIETALKRQYVELGRFKLSDGSQGTAYSGEVELALNPQCSAEGSDCTVNRELGHWPTLGKSLKLGDEFSYAGFGFYRVLEATETEVRRYATFTVEAVPNRAPSGTPTEPCMRTWEYQATKKVKSLEPGKLERCETQCKDEDGCVAACLLMNGGLETEKAFEDEWQLVSNTCNSL